jgi:hypothetical protein
VASGQSENSKAVICGQIKHYELTTNPLTQLKFHHFFVDSLGGTFDVISASDRLKGSPLNGGLLAGDFYLSARILDTASPLREEPRQFNCS